MTPQVNLLSLNTGTDVKHHLHWGEPVSHIPPLLLLYTEPFFFFFKLIFMYFLSSVSTKASEDSQPDPGSGASRDREKCGK